MRWDSVDILEIAHAALRSAADDADAEQAVYGIDALDELGLHPILRRAYRAAGFGVWPEQAYPSDRGRRKRRSEGRRCDLVLTPDGAPLVDPEAEATLFGEPGAIPLEAAYWLEVKTVSQFTTDGPFARYSAELLSPVKRDIRKLAEDPLIYYGALLLVLFTADRQTADRDLATWAQRCYETGYPVAGPLIRESPITERLGNAHLAVALVPVRRL